MRALAVAAFLALFGPAANAAGPAAIHSDPGTDDNLRLYAFVDKPSTLMLDGAAPAQLAAMSVVFLKLEPGAHRADIALPEGAKASLAFTLAPEGMIESKGRKWWCLMVGRRDGKLTMLQPATAQCKAIADAGPD